MAKFQIVLSRERWEVCTVVVEADTKDAAEAEAVSMADNQRYDALFKLTPDFQGAEVLETSELTTTRSPPSG